MIYKVGLTDRTAGEDSLAVLAALEHKMADLEALGPLLRQPSAPKAADFPMKRTGRPAWAYDADLAAALSPRSSTRSASEDGTRGKTAPLAVEVKARSRTPAPNRSAIIFWPTECLISLK